MKHAIVVLFALAATGCAQLGQLAWKAADQAGRYSAGSFPVTEVVAPEGFRVVRVVNGLNFPSAFTWDDAGNLYILESHTVPAPMLKPKIVRVSKEGRVTRVAWRGNAAPTGETAIGLTFRDGWLYFSHEEKDGSFAISRVRPDGGEVERVLGGIPVQGDHDVNHLAFDKDGSLYFGVGSATNSGVVSSGDPVNQKWLKMFPSTHEIPCRDIQLTGITFKDEDGTVSGAFQAHGRSDARSVRGEPLCHGSVYRLRAGSQTPELLAWGFRNPVALAFDRDGTLLVGMHGADVRSTRPVRNDPDSVLRVHVSGSDLGSDPEPLPWYGWPDYNAALEPLPIQPVIDRAASGLTPPDRSLLLAATEPHAALSGMAILADGSIVLAEMGDFRPDTDPDESVRAGFQVERIGPGGGTPATYARNRGEGEPEPASTLDFRNGFERPVDVRVGPDGAVYVLDYGAFITLGGKPKAFPKTGKLFRIEPVR